MRKCWKSLLIMMVILLFFGGCSLVGKTDVSKKEAEWFQGQWVSTTTPKFVLGITEDRVLVTHAMLGKVETTEVSPNYEKQDDLIGLVLDGDSLKELFPKMFQNGDIENGKGIFTRDNSFEKKTGRESLLLTIIYSYGDGTEEEEPLSINFIRRDNEKSEESDTRDNLTESEESSSDKKENRKLTSDEIEEVSQESAQSYTELSNRKKAVIMATLKSEGQTPEEIQVSDYSVIDKSEEQVMVVAMSDDTKDVEKIMLIDTEDFMVLDSFSSNNSKSSDGVRHESTTASTSSFTVPSENESNPLIGNWKISGLASEIIISPYGATYLFGNEKFAFENPKTVDTNTIDYSSSFSINGSANISTVQVEWVSHNKAKVRFHLDDGRTVTEDMIKQ
ncbi:hypothetical protein [Enterococcus xiangfangensis]|uniref:hypothetical protein n=1 Tax=Enterococcus xiangfangensis TaxID=1296537 RepID=UPI0010F7694C|nr:hypothetical protein [Enterococcus xiangfangensis]MBM7712857.1 hypothetical protein [Enterococcus xiangfangensis]